MRNNKDNCSLFYATATRFVWLNYCDPLDIYNKATSATGLLPLEMAFNGPRLLQTIHKFCYLDNNRFLLVGSAASGVASLFKGLVVVWDWNLGYTLPPVETVLDRVDRDMEIQNCNPGYSVFLKHRNSWA